MSVSSVDVITPPITARPSGARKSAPSPCPIATGSMPAMSASVVMMIGRSRMRPASISASRRDIPFSRAHFAKSMSRIAFLATMPISSITPMRLMMFNLCLVARLAALRDAVARRQPHRRQLLLDRIRDLRERSSLHVRLDVHHRHAIEMVDLRGPERLPYVGDLAERKRGGASLRIRDHKRKSLQIREIFTRFGGEAHSHVARLAARVGPVAHLEPRERGPQRLRDLGHRDTQ